MVGEHLLENHDVGGEGVNSLAWACAETLDDVQQDQTVACHHYAEHAEETY